MMIVGSLLPLSLPLIVVANLGTTQNAYFNIAWTMCSAAGLFQAAAGSAFIVEAATPGADRAQLLRQYARMIAAVSVVASLGLGVGGPIVLRCVGFDYFANAAGLMVIMAISTLAETVLTTFYLLAQLVGRLRLLMAAQAIVVGVTVIGAFLLIRPLGLAGIGVASLAAILGALCLVCVRWSPSCGTCWDRNHHWRWRLPMAASTTFQPTKRAVSGPGALRNARTAGGPVRRTASSTDVVCGHISSSRSVPDSGLRPAN